MVIPGQMAPLITAAFARAQVDASDRREGRSMIYAAQFDTILRRGRLGVRANEGRHFRLTLNEFTPWHTGTHQGGVTSGLRDRWRRGAVMRQFLERRQADWWGRLPRYEEHSLRHRSAYTINLCSLTQQSLSK